MLRLQEAPAVAVTEYLSELSAVFSPLEEVLGVEFIIAPMFVDSFKKWLKQTPGKKGSVPPAFARLLNVCKSLVDAWVAKGSVQRYLGPGVLPHTIDKYSDNYASKFLKALPTRQIPMDSVVHLHFKGDDTLIFAILESGHREAATKKSANLKSVPQKSVPQKSVPQKSVPQKSATKALVLLGIGLHSKLYEGIGTIGGGSLRRLFMLRLSRRRMKEARLKRLLQEAKVQRVVLNFPEGLPSDWWNLHSPMVEFGSRWGRGVVGEVIDEKGVYSEVAVSNFAGTHAGLKRGFDRVLRTFYWGFLNGVLYLAVGTVDLLNSWTNSIIKLVVEALSQKLLKELKYSDGLVETTRARTLQKMLGFDCAMITACRCCGSAERMKEVNGELVAMSKRERIAKDREWGATLKGHLVDWSLEGVTDETSVGALSIAAVDGLSIENFRLDTETNEIVADVAGTVPTVSVVEDGVTVATAEPVLKLENESASNEPASNEPATSKPGRRVPVLPQRITLEKTYFVQNRGRKPGFREFIEKLGRQFMQDSILWIPGAEMGRVAYLVGLKAGVFPGDGVEVRLGSRVLERRRFMTRIRGRPLAYEGSKGRRFFSVMEGRLRRSKTFSELGW